MRHFKVGLPTFGFKSQIFLLKVTFELKMYISFKHEEDKSNFE